MESIVSTKYQIVIPKALRKQLDIKPGQKVELTKVDGIIHVEPKLTPQQIVDKYAGSLTGAWGKEDPSAWIRRDRDQSDRGPDSDRRSRY
jgi:AbrB family looped-hinge helix DNA binding protein